MVQLPRGKRSSSSKTITLIPSQPLLEVTCLVLDAPLGGRPSNWLVLYVGFLGHTTPAMSICLRRFQTKSVQALVPEMTAVPLFSILRVDWRTPVTLETIFDSASVPPPMGVRAFHEICFCRILLYTFTPA